MIFEQYKKTFWGMQTVMLFAFVLIWAISHSLSLAALFFTVMQGASMIGASWAVRLKHKVTRDAGLGRA